MEGVREKGTAVVAASRDCSCPTTAGPGAAFSPHMSRATPSVQRSSRPVVPGCSPYPLGGRWGYGVLPARPEGVMAGRVRDGAVGWPELFKQGSALWVRGRSVGEEQRRGVPKASVCPCCLVCQT